jgi:N-acetylneuraminic acid mutarotase
MPTAREDAASAVVGGKIYVFGGLTNPGHTFAASIDIYDPASNTWETRSWAMPRALGDSGVAHNGKIYLIGGTADMSHYPTDLRASSETSVYDPATGTWTTGAVVPVPACYREIEELGGRLYAMSGTTQTVTTYTSDAIIYDPVTDVWDVLPDLVYAARGAGLTKCGNSLYLSGGFNGAYLNWLYRVRR